jgi:transposase
VASRPLGASGKAMLRELCEGNNDPVALADLAKGKLRAKLPLLRQALEGRFRDHHALLVTHLLAHIEYLDQTITELSLEIEERMRPFERQRELLCTIPGVAELTAEVIIAELGPDMSRFPTHRHAASWAAVCPGHDESAGKRRSGKTRKGDSWLRTALIEAAQSAAGRTTDTYLHSQYLRVKRRRGHKKAIVAVAHSILVAAYYILRDEVPYQELGGDYFVRREDPERLTQRLVRQLERLGQSVMLKPALEAR